MNRNCGRFTVRGVDPSVPGKCKYFTVFCKCWDCVICGPKRAKRYRKAIRKLAAEHGLRIFLTLTLDPSKLGGENSARYINRVFAKFRTYLKREYGHAPDYIRVLEFQKSGIAHFHVLLKSQIPQSWISKAWSALGGGHIVDIRQREIWKIANYVSKYLTKELLLSAPKRSRRVTTSRSIRLFERKPKEARFEFLPLPIETLFDMHYASIIGQPSLDSEKRLLGFECAVQCLRL
jgi:hypothetical protein